MAIKCQPPVIFVKDVTISRRFYEDLLDQKVMMDFGLNVSFEGGFALWQVDHAHQMIFNSPVSDTSPLGRKNIELCFEADDLDAVLAQVTEAQVQFVCPPHEQPWGQRVFHIYDPDGHIVELGEPMQVVVARFLAEGMSAEETAQRTGMPLEMVQQIAQAAARQGAEVKMKSQATPEFVISQMRVQTMPEITFFYVSHQPMPFTDLDKDFDSMLDSLYAAKAQAGLSQAGPDMTRYYKAGHVASDLYMMEIGIPVKPGTQPAGAAQVKVLPPYHCAGLLLWGSLAHIGPAYETLKKAIQEAGLEHTGENREWVYYFESGESPHNLMGIYMGVK